MFRSLSQRKADKLIVLCQSLLNMSSDYDIVNADLKKKFEVQPVNADGLPAGDLLQISVPNETIDE